MRRFFNNLFRDFRTTSSARGGRGAPRRVSLGLESLENRLVPSTASFANGILSITGVAPGHSIGISCNAGNNNEVQVYDEYSADTLVYQGNKQSINTFEVQLSSGNGVGIDDSNGMPFAYNTNVYLTGTGKGNTLTLGGSRTVSGNETYVPGFGPASPAFLSVDNSNIHFDNSITSIIDFLPITGTDDVQTSGANVTLLNKLNNEITGLGPGAGGALLNFWNKPTLELEEYAANATINLDDPGHGPLNGVPDPPEPSPLFVVNMHGAGDTTVIAATPANEVTEVQTIVAPVANPASVLLEANAGPVEVYGNTSTTLRIGQKLSNGLFSTQGIQGNVTVQGVGGLSLLDNGNDTTAQNVTVTEKSVSGTGLFGNDNPTLSYAGVSNLSINSGQLADQYTVEGSGPYVQFSTKISITDSSNTGFRTDVYVGIFADLNLSVVNPTELAAAQLVIHTISSQTVSDPSPMQGVVDVTFADVFTSQISYDGFTPVVVQG
jgi:hypothetical protein